VNFSFGCFIAAASQLERPQRRRWKEQQLETLGAKVFHFPSNKPFFVPSLLVHSFTERILSVWSILNVGDTQRKSEDAISHAHWNSPQTTRKRETTSSRGMTITFFNVHSDQKLLSSFCYQNLNSKYVRVLVVKDLI
jgi:hypothetical protein